MICRTLILVTLFLAKPECLARQSGDGRRRRLFTVVLPVV